MWGHAAVPAADEPLMSQMGSKPEHARGSACPILPGADMVCERVHRSGVPFCLSARAGLQAHGKHEPLPGSLVIVNSPPIMRAELADDGENRARCRRSAASSGHSIAPPMA